MHSDKLWKAELPFLTIFFLQFFFYNFFLTNCVKLSCRFFEQNEIRNFCGFSAFIAAALFGEIKPDGNNFFILKNNLLCYFFERAMFMPEAEGMRLEKR